MKYYNFNSQLNIFKVAYIVAENKRRSEINLEFLNKFYTEHQIETHQATDNLPHDAYLDPKLPYTQTGKIYLYFMSMYNVMAY